MKVTVIIPVLKEDLSLPEGFDECIVVAGGSSPPVRQAVILSAPPGRASQMNAGAQIAQGDILLFLHADTRLPARAAERIRQAVRNGVVGGCFETAFDPPHPILRTGDVWRNIRARLFREFYGDQSIFIRRRVFERIGGYRHLDFMEDYDLCRRMRKCGQVAFIGARALTSGRTYLNSGILRTWLRHQRLKIRYLLNGSTPASVQRDPRRTESAAFGYRRSRFSEWPPPA